MREGRILQTAPPRELYERPRSRFVADFVGFNNFVPGVCRDVTADRATIDTVLGAVRGMAAEGVIPGGRCVLAVRPENLVVGNGGDNTIEARVLLASYLGHALRYDVEAAAGVRLKVDVRDPLHHEPLATGQRVRIGFGTSTALVLADDVGAS